jgi:hypothetical protein
MSNKLVAISIYYIPLYLLVFCILLKLSMKVKQFYVVFRHDLVLDIVLLQNIHQYKYHPISTHSKRP